MATKVTHFFEIGTVYGDDVSYRVGGWSESWIHPAEMTSAAVKDDAQELGRKRAKLLAKQGSIVAYRMQQVFPDKKPGRAKVHLIFLKGNAAYNTDVPQMAYGFRCQAAGQNMRMVELRGFPDQFVEKGEASLTPQYERDLSAYQDFLVKTGWMFRGINMDTPTIEIESVSALGVVRTVEDFVPPAIGKKVQIIRTKQSGTRDDFFGSVNQLVIVDNARQIQVRGWEGDVCTGGKIRIYTHDFFPAREMENEAVFVRKVGRPFFQYRGRASTKG